MELNAVAERSSAARFTARRFCETDPQECGGLRQGNIALIHSRSQEKDFLMVRRRTQASVRSLRKLGYGAVSNHESPDAAILRDAALRLLLRMRAKDFG
jgi:hypothetical protein